MDTSAGPGSQRRNLDIRRNLRGFAGAGVGSSVLIFAGFAGLVAGTLAMGAVEYSKLRAQRDQQVAQTRG